MVSLRSAALIVGAIFLCSPSLTIAQATAADSKATLLPPRTPSGRPDFNGVWSGRGHADLSAEMPGGLPFTDAGKAAFEDVKKQYDPTGFCLYPGVTRLTNSPYPLEIVQTPGRMAILYEYMRTFRVIPTDGREHSQDPSPSFFGESVGKWEGDVFVVDVIGFNDRSWLDAAGNPHTDALHLIERYRLTDAQHLAYEVTIDDPKTYTKPWKSTMVFTRRLDWELIEYSCDENNKDRDQHHFQPGPSFQR
jgi:hypothetical protein